MPPESPSEFTEWKLVRLPDFKPPPEPTTETLRKSLRKLWRRVRGGSDRDREPVQKDLKAAGARLIHRVAPEPTWEGAAAAILEALPELREPDSSVQRVLVGGPRNGIDQGVRVLAREHGWDVLATPTFREILEGGTTFVDRIDWKNHQKVLVAPRLDDLIMRQFDGLGLLRRWLDRVLTSRRPCLIVCGSWAWAFLARSIQIDSVFPTPLTQHAFDAVNLGKWFQELAAPTQSRALRFLQSDIGIPVLPKLAAGNSAADRAAEWEDLSGYLKYAAAYCRGNPAVALEVWRASLRTSPDQNYEDDGSESKPSGDPDVVWVSPWSELRIPTVPDLLSRLETFALHALLVHAGLEAESLGHVLSIDQRQTMKTLSSLQRIALVETERTVWKVATVAYPAVRDYLAQENYLTDRHLRRST